MNNLMKKALQRRGPAPDFPSAAPLEKPPFKMHPLPYRRRPLSPALVFPPPEAYACPLPLLKKIPRRVLDVSNNLQKPADRSRRQNKSTLIKDAFILPQSLRDFFQSPSINPARENNRPMVEKIIANTFKTIYTRGSSRSTLSPPSKKFRNNSLSQV